LTAEPANSLKVIAKVLKKTLLDLWCELWLKLCVTPTRLRAPVKTGVTGFTQRPHLSAVRFVKEHPRVG